MLPPETSSPAAAGPSADVGAGETISIVFNGAPRRISAGATVAQLLAELGMVANYLAVEVNLQLVPRGRHRACVLFADDRVEVVTLVGGG